MRVAIEARVQQDPPADFPAALGYDVLLIAGQVGLDRGDPMSFASHVLTDRLAPGSGPEVLLQESTGDGIIPNITTEALARALELPLVEPAQLGAPGLDRTPTPTCGAPASGLSQFLISDMPFQAHLALESQNVQAQVMTWFQSFVDEDPGNDGNIAFVSLGAEIDCD